MFVAIPQLRASALAKSVSYTNVGLVPESVTLPVLVTVNLLVPPTCKSIRFTVFQPVISVSVMLPLMRLKRSEPPAAPVSFKVAEMSIAISSVLLEVIVPPVRRVVLIPLATLLK